MEVDGSSDFPFLNWSFFEVSALHFQGNRLGGFLVCWGVAVESETTPLKSPKELKDRLPSINLQGPKAFSFRGGIYLGGIWRPTKQWSS